MANSSVSSNLLAKLAKANIIMSNSNEWKGEKVAPPSGVKPASEFGRQRAIVDRLAAEQKALIDKQPKEPQDYSRLGEVTDALFRESARMKQVNPTGVLGYGGSRSGGRRRSSTRKYKKTQKRSRRN